MEYFVTSKYLKFCSIFLHLLLRKCFVRHKQYKAVDNWSNFDGEIVDFDIPLNGRQIMS